MAALEPDVAGPPRSTFVTVLAWIFIVLSGMATLVSIVQNLMVTMMFNAATLAPIEPRAGEEGIAAFVNFMFGNFRLFFLAMLVFCALMLAASIGLLMRRNWGRMLFIAMMILGMVWNVAGMALMLLFFAAFSGLAPENTPPAQGFQTFAIVAGAVNALMAIAFTVLFGWIVKRLLSPEIRGEFVAG